MATYNVGMTLSPISGYHCCLFNCPAPTPETLTVEDSVFGSFTLTWQPLAANWFGCKDVTVQSSYAAKYPAFPYSTVGLSLVATCSTGGRGEVTIESGFTGNEGMSDSGVPGFPTCAYRASGHLPSTQEFGTSNEPGGSGDNCPTGSGFVATAVNVVRDPADFPGDPGTARAVEDWNAFYDVSPGDTVTWTIVGS